eukprot:TRINITY_DN4156_c0_g1_i3.p1 TRINITY_DN4156_c0_g1~~TRINITY_DN4156_c0_g1_i3.p1  ORF type:complete len:290 (-),score=61.09 TRINITY_DN4156_c0_g1_i3:94-963(-)
MSLFVKRICSVQTQAFFLRSVATVTSPYDQLKGRVALITGAGSGLGEAIALRFAREGMKVGVCDLNLDAASRVAKEIESQGGKALPIKMDVSVEKDVEDGTEALYQHFGQPVYTLVSNAGLQHIQPIHELKLEMWRKMMAVHLDGAFLTTRACMKQMIQHKTGGAILYMGSVHSKEASKLKAPYVSAKHALIGLCKAVAKEGAEHKIWSNVICPGYVKTPLVMKQIPEQAKQFGISEEEVIKNIFLKDTVDYEFTTPEDIAQVTWFFAAFSNRALTGQSLNASHGWCMH